MGSGVSGDREWAWPPARHSPAPPPASQPRPQAPWRPSWPPSSPSSSSPCSAPGPGTSGRTGAGPAWGGAASRSRCEDDIMAAL
ncbi:WAS/WASL-interacting protein family member 3-like [Mus caroli]|uniref:WAS/WASL-interacting protein family member 3-like n=1 Tax=Mus caroli TaxID=10089 RepID=A0A6P5P5J5_MUSCR|nr:WAS/WASL-interacting protein family member 3-like [Mus caroli]